MTSLMEMNLTVTVEKIGALTAGNLRMADESVNERAEGGARLAQPYLLTMVAAAGLDFLKNPLSRC